MPYSSDSCSFDEHSMGTFLKRQKIYLALGKKNWSIEAISIPWMYDVIIWCEASWLCLLAMERFMMSKRVTWRISKSRINSTDTILTHFVYRIMSNSINLFQVQDKVKWLVNERKASPCVSSSSTIFRRFFPSNTDYFSRSWIVLYGNPIGLFIYRSVLQHWEDNLSWKTMIGYNQLSSSMTKLSRMNQGISETLAGWRISFEITKLELIRWLRNAFCSYIRTQLLFFRFIRPSTNCQIHRLSHKEIYSRFLSRRSSFLTRVCWPLWRGFQHLLSTWFFQKVHTNKKQEKNIHSEEIEQKRKEKWDRDQVYRRKTQHSQKRKQKRIRSAKKYDWLEQR